MDLNLPSILTDAQVVFYGGATALLVGILQQLSWIPLADGSKPRAWAVALVAALFVGLSAPETTLAGPALALGLILSWVALASASLGLNRAGSFTIQAAKERAAQPTVADYDPNKPTGDEGEPQG